MKTIIWIISISIFLLALIAGCAVKTNDPSLVKDGEKAVTSKKIKHTVIEHYDGGYEKWEKTEKITK